MYVAGLREDIVGSPQQVGCRGGERGGVQTRSMLKVTACFCKECSNVPGWHCEMEQQERQGVLNSAEPAVTALLHCSAVGDVAAGGG